MDDLRRSEHDLDISRRRKNRDGADLMVEKPGKKYGIDRREPLRAIVTWTQSKKRMAGCDEDGAGLDRRLNQELRVSPRIERQRNRGSRRRPEEPMRINAAAREKYLRDGQFERIGCLLTFRFGHRFDDRAAQVGLAQDVADIARQDRPRTDFDKDPQTFLQKTIQGCVELHRFAHIPPPVIGPERLAVEEISSHRRDKLLADLQRLQSLQFPQQRCLEGIDERTVERVVEIQASCAYP